ncbi:MAG: dihydroorotate dehydrogenase [Gammaproteobacteria bacterium]|nr:dihydroorotate dehydrogenase [Gammaproteobacteria bacterium]
MKFLGVAITSPIVLPAGILGISTSSLKRVIKSGAGFVTTKSISLKPRAGHAGPIFAEFKGGIVNAVGLSNPGIEVALDEVNEFKETSNVNAKIIVSVFGGSVADFSTLALAVNNSKADFLELNLSCPNVHDEFSHPFATSAEHVFEIVHAVKKVAQLPVIAKLSPNVVSIKPIALAAEKAGADALTLINTVGPGMLIDPYACKPILKNKVGGLSGPCIKPIALKIIYETYQAVKIPIIGMGGVTNGIDAIEMLMAGATLIGVGSAVYYRGPNVFKLILKEMHEFLTVNGYGSFQEIIGKAHHG